MLSTEHEYVRSEPERWHNHELERSILGGLILDPRLVSAACTTPDNRAMDKISTVSSFFIIFLLR